MRILAMVSLLAAGLVTTAQAAQEITVYKSATCGCCKKWVSYLEQNGYQVKAQDMADLRFIKTMSGVKPQYASCLPR